MSTTELQFLIDLLLNHKLPIETKKLVASRIGEVEAKYSAQSFSHPISMVQTKIPAGVQCASTQALLDKHSNDSVQSDLTPVAQVAGLPTAPPVTKRIVGGEVVSGNGTRGPRKF